MGLKVSFIIPVYNCLDLTRAMLASLQATLPAALAHEIVLVDDGSTDGTREWLATLPAPVRDLHNPENLGFAGACNRAADTATGEVLFFLNNDLVCLPGWFEPILAALETLPQPGLVGNVQRNFATDAVDHAGVVFNGKGKPEHLRRLPRGQNVREVVAVTGACFAIEHALWRQLGGFDRRYRNGCEDVDLALQARAAGRHNYVVLRSVVRHHVSATMGRKARDEQNTARLLERWHEAVVPLIDRPVARAVLAAAWEEPRDYADPSLARWCLVLLAAGVGRFPRRLRSVAASAIALEQARWRELLDQVPAPPPRAIAPALFPVIPEAPPVW